MQKLLLLTAVGFLITTGVTNAGGPSSGCSSCDGGSCKPSLFDKFKGHGDDCGSCSPSWFGKHKGYDSCDGCNDGKGLGGIWGWCKRPCGNPAPTWRNTGYPLAFPSHPYIRSPRDYFMDP